MIVVSTQTLKWINVAFWCAWTGIFGWQIAKLIIHQRRFKNKVKEFDKSFELLKEAKTQSAVELHADQCDAVIAELRRINDSL